MEVANKPPEPLNHAPKIMQGRALVLCEKLALHALKHSRSPSRQWTRRGHSRHGPRCNQNRLRGGAPFRKQLIAAVNIGQVYRFARRLINARQRQLRTYQVHELLLAVHIELRIDVLGVAAHGVLCQVQRFCDVGLRAALAQHLHHLKLARR